MKLATLLLCACLSPFLALTSLAKDSADHRQLLEKSEKIVMLGDSITYAGHYVANFETWLTLSYPKRSFSVINLGLSSETVSGLSEKGHAGGRFPRPDLHERLDRVLTKTKPDLIFACYGMNCGIYLPFDQERFQQYQDGILKLKSAAEKSGAKIVFITPPIYDSNVGKNKAHYTEVLERYAAWLVSQRKQGWNVIDLNSHMTKVVEKNRKDAPQFTFQKDAVHPNAAGHWVMTQPILSWFGDHPSANSPSPQEMVKHLKGSPKLLKLITTRSQLLRNTWLTETGHKRPGIKQGLPLDQAIPKVKDISQKIQQL